MKFILIGAGDVGISLSERLVHANYEVTLIEKSESAISKIPPHLDCQIIHGNGCSPEVLLKAGINTANYLIAVTEIDEVNIATCLMAKLINPAIKRVGRVRLINLYHKEISQDHLSEYFDLIINPAQAGAEYMTQLYQVPGARDIIEFAEGKLRVIGVKVANQSKYCNTRINSLKDHYPNSPLLVIALIRGDSLIVPRGNDELKAGDLMYAIAENEYTNVLFEIAGRPIKQPDNVMIWGGSTLTLPLTHYMENLGVKVKLILDESEINEELVDQFDNILVLHGRGTDQELLLEENIKSFDTFIAASPAEEDNILAALLAKKLGAGTTMALVNKRAYLQLVSAIGVDVVVSTEVAAASQIFRHIHSEDVVSEFTLGFQPASFIEIQAKTSDSIAGKAIQDLKFPTGTLIAAIERAGTVIIPDGSQVIEKEDTLVIFALHQSIKKLQKVLDINLELLH